LIVPGRAIFVPSLLIFEEMRIPGSMKSVYMARVFLLFPLNVTSFHDPLFSSEIKMLTPFS